MPSPLPLVAFAREFSRVLETPLETPAELQQASVAHFRAFWRCLAQWVGEPLGWTGPYHPVCEADTCERARFFPAVRLNYAASLLSPCVAPDDAIALVECRSDGGRQRITRGELRMRVERVAAALANLGVGEGERVVAVLRNDASAITLALAVTATGATLSTASPDMGLDAITDRFEPLRPRWLVSHAATRAFDTGEPLAGKLALLGQRLPDLKGVIRLDGEPLAGSWPQYSLDELANRGEAWSFSWPQFGFNHPLFILFSSGTTGRPKCIVHGAGGSLIEHLKEHRLHTGLQAGDRMYFHTSCSWMMWHWQLSALASGVEIVTWDGPVANAGTLWQLVARERVAVFGTSPAYLRMSQDAGLSPARDVDLSSLRAILSTGAVLHEAQFDWVREHVGSLPLQSISGGTDILGCFVLGHPQLPVRRVQAQCRSLGLDVQAWEGGRPVPGVGQLVCVNPFPSRPLGFFGDTDGSAFHAAYFAQNPGVWTHGDLIEFFPEGGACLRGRSDGLLNVRGIKMMPVEICRVLDGDPQVVMSLVVEYAGPPPRVVALLVLSQAGPDPVDESDLFIRLRREVARRLSPAHVPDRFVAVPELPLTHSGKLSEAAARSAINGVSAANFSALRNPQCLQAIRERFLCVQTSGGQGLQEAVETGMSLEAQLQAMWRQQLEIPHVGLDDHFLELGGDSLHAAVIMTRVEQMTGRSLPLGTLLQAPTVRALAARVREAPRAEAQTPVVTLRPGVGPPLVLVHGLSGTVMECWALVDALRTRRPVLGLQARGLDGEAPPRACVQEMADDYVQALRRDAPSGSYALCGFSFGGLVALEMARILAQGGETVALLCLLDPYLRRDLALVPRLWHRGWHIVTKLLLLAPVARRQYLSRLVERCRVLISGRSAQVGAAPVASGQLRESHRQVIAALQRALMAYRPVPHEGGPVLFVRARLPLDGYLNPMPVWRKVLRGRLQVVKVPGSHLDLVRAQGPQVAEIIDRALAPAQGQDADHGCGGSIQVSPLPGGSP